MHERLEALERPKAAARKAEGQKSGGRGKKKLESKLDASLQRTDVKVAEVVGSKTNPGAVQRGGYIYNGIADIWQTCYDITELNGPG